MNLFTFEDEGDKVVIVLDWVSDVRTRWLSLAGSEGAEVVVSFAFGLHEVKRRFYGPDAQASALGLQLHLLEALASITPPTFDVIEHVAVEQRATRSRP